MFGLSNAEDLTLANYEQSRHNMRILTQSLDQPDLPEKDRSYYEWQLQAAKSNCEWYMKLLDWLNG